MKTFATIAGRFREEEDGAALIEYTVLVGIITVGVIATVIAVGTWVSGSWTSLCTSLDTTDTGCTVAGG